MNYDPALERALLNGYSQLPQDHDENGQGWGRVSKAAVLPRYERVNYDPSLEQVQKQQSSGYIQLNYDVSLDQVQKASRYERVNYDPSLEQILLEGHADQLTKVGSRFGNSLC